MSSVPASYSSNEYGNFGTKSFSLTAASVAISFATTVYNVPPALVYSSSVTPCSSSTLRLRTTTPVIGLASTTAVLYPFFFNQFRVVLASTTITSGFNNGIVYVLHPQIRIIRFHGINRSFTAMN